MSSEDGTHIKKPASELFREIAAVEYQHKSTKVAPLFSSDVNQTEKDDAQPMAAKAVNYPPGYPSNKQKEQCDKREEKHMDCHPMHCHHMQPMQSQTTTTATLNTADHQHQNQKHDPGNDAK